MKIIIISAMDPNNIIGNDNKIPWHIKDEFIHFKNTTFESTVIMGRNTFESLKNPLKNRRNIVITHNKNYKTNLDNILIFNNLESSLEYCKQLNLDKVFIIGGAMLYKESLNIADEMILSFIKHNVEGNIFFPKIRYSDWKLSNEIEYSEFIIKYFVRKI